MIKLRPALLVLVLLFGIDVLMPPAMAAPPGLNVKADRDQLDGTVIKRLASRFDQDIRRHGAEGLWADIQSCYAQARARSDKRKAIGQCLIMDEAGKILDDAHVQNAAKPGATVVNKAWYTTLVFEERIKGYSQIGFGDPYGSKSFVAKNMNGFLEAIGKLN